MTDPLCYSAPLVFCFFALFISFYYPSCLSLQSYLDFLFLFLHSLFLRWIDCIRYISVHGSSHLVSCFLSYLSLALCPATHALACKKRKKEGTTIPYVMECLCVKEVGLSWQDPKTGLVKCAGLLMQNFY